MKNFLTKIIALSSVTLLMLSACKKDGTLITATNGTPGALTSSTVTPVLSSANLTSSTNVVAFNFTSPNFGYNAAVTNVLQIDIPGDNWATPYTVALSNGVLSQSFNTADFNNILLKIKMPGGVSGTVNVRVLQSIGTSTFVYSNVLALTTTPFNLKSWIYAVGDFQGWNAANPDSLLSATGNGVYTGIINFVKTTQFLILPQKNSYNNKIATTQSSTPTSTTLVNASNNLLSPGLGYYIVTYNSNLNTISFTAADYYSIIGDAAQGWSTDIAMKYINDGTNNWTLTLPLVSTGGFKVRQDNAWTNSWGIPNSGSAGYGIANTINNTSNGNITITPSGNYAVSFVAPATAFGTTVGTSAGNNQIVTTTYSAVKQ
jgi:starch-binding outer membrane protein SusE/F